jgi:hypothetical protein
MTGLYRTMRRGSRAASRRRDGALDRRGHRPATLEPVAEVLHLQPPARPPGREEPALGTHHDENLLLAGARRRHPRATRPGSAPGFSARKCTVPGLASRGGLRDAAHHGASKAVSVALIGRLLLDDGHPAHHKHEAGSAEALGDVGVQVVGQGCETTRATPSSAKD